MINESITLASTVSCAPILVWKDAAFAGPSVCGGKGHRLGQLDLYGFRVPRGGVIPASWYTEVLRVVPPRLLSAVRHISADQAMEPAVLHTIEQIRSCIAAAGLPPAMDESLIEFMEQMEGATIAVRSSATAEDSAQASFAGIHQSFLNVRGHEALVQAILGCYASLWTPQALAYRRMMRFSDTDVQCAVVICEMVHAEGADEPHCAGVGFTFDPVSGRRDLLVIDAAPGIGENVVSGRVNPQRIVFRNIKGRLHFESRSGASLLPAKVERELAYQLFRLHWAFGDGQEPQDVEWAYDGERLWILQARPATKVRRLVPAPVRHMPRFWSTANIKDAVPGVVCTLSWSLLKDAVESVAFAAAIAAGYQLEKGTELLRRFDGRAYFDLTLMQWVMYDSLGITPQQVGESIGGHQPYIDVSDEPFKGRAGRRRMIAALRLVRRLWSVEREVAAIAQRRDARLQTIGPDTLRKLPPAGLRRLFEELCLDSDTMDIATGLANNASGPWEQWLAAALKPVFGDRARPLMGRLLAGTGSVTSAEHGYAMQRLADAAAQDLVALHWLGAKRPAMEWADLPESSPFRKELASFLEKYGHRGVYEVDYVNPRWIEDPSYVLDQVRYMLAHPNACASRDAAQQLCEEAEQTVRHEAGWRAPLILWLARNLRTAMAVREAAKSAMVKSALPSKRFALEIGRRLVLAGHLDEEQQVLHLAAADLLCWLEGWWDGKGAGALAADREGQREAWLAQEGPTDVIVEEPSGRVTAGAMFIDRAGETWSGIGAAPGQAQGMARIIHHPNQGYALKAGEVLVAPSTDPGWTPLFLRASAIVMSSGGYLSHGAIVAREYGIPAVVNIPGILTDLASGDMITVDGDAGRVMRDAKGCSR